MKLSLILLIALALTSTSVMALPKTGPAPAVADLTFGKRALEANDGKILKNIAKPRRTMPIPLVTTRRMSASTFSVSRLSVYHSRQWWCVSSLCSRSMRCHCVHELLKLPLLSRKWAKLDNIPLAYGEFITWVGNIPQCPNGAWGDVMMVAGLGGQFYAPRQCTTYRRRCDSCNKKILWEFTTY